MNSSFSISRPCPVDLTRMTLVQHGRHCTHCSKDVIDMRHWSREAILGYLLARPNGSVCGMLNKEQLDARTVDPYVVIEGLSDQQKQSGLPIKVLTLASLLMIGCNDEQEGEGSKGSIVQKELKALKGKEEKVAPKPPQGDSTKQACEADSSKIQKIDGELMVAGEMRTFPEDDTIQKSYGIVEDHPEFPGGHDSLVAFLKREIRYPEYEKKKGIEGKVFVKFIVDSTGTIRDPRVLRSVENARNFDEAVLSGIKRMPEWIPGEQQGEAVDSRVVIPVDFRIPEKKTSDRDTGIVNKPIITPIADSLPHNGKEKVLDSSERTPPMDSLGPRPSSMDSNRIGESEAIGFKLYPNPAGSEGVTLKLEGSGGARYLIHDRSGQLKKRGSFDGEKSLIQTESLSDGAYSIIVLKGEDGGRKKASGTLIVRK